jgi:hypothetical protein
MAKVVVVGGGTSGFAAAIAAARAGAEVSLLEQSSYLGGTMTGGLVPGIVSLRHQPWRDQETLVEMETSYAGDQVVQGIAQELIDRLIAAGGAYGEPGQATIRVSFDPEIMKVVIDKMCREAGVAVEYNTKVTDVLRESYRIAGVRANFGDEIKGDFVIDTTGDAHVAWLAGARYEQGENGDPTYVQPITMYFLMGGVDLGRTIEYACSGREDFSEGYLRKLRKLFDEGKPLTIPGLPRLREAAAQAGDYPSAFGSTTLNPRAHNNILRPIFRNGKVVYDTTMHNVDMAYRVDATDNRTLSEAIGSMREFTLRIGEFYRKYVPGYETAFVLQIADNIGGGGRRALGRRALRLGRPRRMRLDPPAGRLHRDRPGGGRRGGAGGGAPRGGSASADRRDPAGPQGTGCAALTAPPWLRRRRRVTRSRASRRSSAPVSPASRSAAAPRIERRSRLFGARPRTTPASQALRSGTTRFFVSVMAVCGSLRPRTARPSSSMSTFMARGAFGKLGVISRAEPSAVFSADAYGIRFWTRWSV